MIWPAVLMYMVVEIIQWRRTKRLTERVASLEFRLWNLRQEHDALLIILGNDDQEPRMLS